MKRISILGIIVLILLLSVQPAAAITGGEPDGEGHPNVGLLVVDIDGEPAWRCTGKPVMHFHGTLSSRFEVLSQGS